MALYDNLPGIELTVKDGNLVLPAESVATDTVLIIAPVTKAGRATPAKLSVNPKRIRESEDFAKNGLGVFDKTNPLAKAWKQVHDAGCRSIYVLELTGTTHEERYNNLHSIYAVIEENFRADIILLNGVYADDEINTESVSLTIPREDYAAAGDVVTAKDTPVLESFTESDGVNLNLTSPVIASTIIVSNVKTRADQALTVDGEDSKVYPITDTGTINVTSVSVDGSEQASGWSYDETKRAVVFESEPSGAVTANYTVTNQLTLETDYAVDPDARRVMLTAATPATETTTVKYSTYSYSYPSQLAGFCAVVSAKNNQILGVQELKPAEDGDLATIKSYIDGQAKQSYNQYLQIVGGTTMLFEIGNEPYVGGFAGAYAGLMSVLPSYSAPTNKVIPGAISTSYNLSPNQIKGLINKHIIVPRIRNGRIVVADAITTAADSSDFVRLSTVRIVNDAVNLVRDIADPYIGEPNSLAKRNALDTAIKSGLTAMVRGGALNDFRFSISASVADQIDGNMRIVLDLVPVFETRRILATVALKPAL